MSRLCRLLKVSPAGYYAWQKRGISAHTKQDRELTSMIRKIFDGSGGTYGCPRVHQELRKHGVRVSARRIGRLMRADGMRGRVVRVYRARAKQHQMYAAHDNQVRHHRATRPDVVWVGDVTYLKVARHWCYLAVVMDQCSRRILAWALRLNRGTLLTRSAFDAAYRARKPGRLIFHSDRGIEYTAPGFRDRLTTLGVRQSTTRGGSPGENAHAESFFHSLKADVIHGVQFVTDESMRACIRSYVRYYNHKRLHSALGYRSPVEFERVAA